MFLTESDASLAIFIQILKYKPINCHNIVNLGRKSYIKHSVPSISYSEYGIQYKNDKTILPEYCNVNMYTLEKVSIQTLFLNKSETYTSIMKISLACQPPFFKDTTQTSQLPGVDNLLNGKFYI